MSTFALIVLVAVAVQQVEALKCTSAGYFADPANGCKFYQCAGVGYSGAHMTCAPGTKWDQSKLTCVHGSCVTTPATTPAPATGFKCTAAGYFADPTNGCKFYQCAGVGGSGNLMTCAPGTKWDQSQTTCVHGSCVATPAPTPAPTPFSCPGTGYYADITNPCKFWQCDAWKTAHHMKCAKGTNNFSQAAHVCVGHGPCP